MGMTRPRETLRRRAPRVSIGLEGSLVARAARDVTVIDMSLSGCLVRCPLALDRGSIHDLRLVLGSDPFVAKVRATDASLDGSSAPGEPRYLVGLEFLGLAARDQTRLRAFLDERMRRGGSATAG
jgi:c-di-GMP-binding flagellar brake protein YcgR